MAFKKKTHYEVLGVPPSAPFPAIKAAFMRLARKHHPDKARPGSSSLKFGEITEAYRVLSDSTTRYVYDMELGISPAGEVIPVGARLEEPTVTGNAAVDYSEEISGGIPVPFLVATGESSYEVAGLEDDLLYRAYSAGLYSIGGLEKLPMRSYYESGLSALRKKKYAAAVFFLSEAVKMNARNIQYRFALGAAMEALGNREKAVFEYREVLRLGGLKKYDCLPVREALIRVLTEGRDYPGAKAEALEIQRRGLKSIAAEGALRLARVMEKKDPARGEEK